MLREVEVLTPDVAALLARAMYPDAGRIERQLALYRTEPGRRLYVWNIGSTPVCAAGVRVKEAVEVLHIGTAPDHERQGHGRSLVLALAARHPDRPLVAETDDGAVDFYRRLGFEVEPVSTPYGRVRYRCVLTSP